MAATRIDVHQHILLPEYVRALAGVGVTTSGGSPFPDWSADAAFAAMEQADIAASVLSVSSPGVYFGDAGFARRLARTCNETLAGLARDYPDWFAWLAILPLPDMAGALVELEYAVDTLHADGVILLGSSGDVFLGDPGQDELLAELHRRRAVAFLHPNLHSTSDRLGLPAPGFLVEFVVDTARAVVNLLLAGAFARFPGIRWVLAHAGGFVPYIAGRLAMADQLPGVKEKCPRGVLAYLKQLHYDTALASPPHVLRAVLDFAGPDRVLFGTDHPYAPADQAREQAAAVGGFAWPDAATRAAVEHENAVRLFPRLEITCRPPGPAPAGR